MTDYSIQEFAEALNQLLYLLVGITQPLDGAYFLCAGTIEIEAEAYDVDGTVVKVEFFANRSKIGEDTTDGDGWAMSWTDHSSADSPHSLIAKATDNEGRTTNSSAIEITTECGL